MEESSGAVPSTMFRSHWAPSIKDPTPRSFVPVSTWEKKDEQVQRSVQVQRCSAVKVWDDSGMDAHPHHVAFYRPSPPTGFHSVGDVATRTHGEEPVLMCHALKDVTLKLGASAPSIPLLAEPTGFYQVWESTGSSAASPGSIWRPIPPEGYVSLGCVAGDGTSPPPLSCVRCVHVSAVKRGQAEFEEVVFNSSKDGLFLWCDRKTHASFGNVSVWRIGAWSPVGFACGTFTAVPHHGKPGTHHTSAPSESANESAIFVLLNPSYTVGSHTDETVARAAEGVSRQTDHAASLASSGARSSTNSDPISYIPFEVNPSRVKGLFEAWKQQLWFAPGDFKNSTSNPRFDGIFVPFYAVGAEVTTRFSMTFGRDEQQRTKSGEERNTVRDRIECASEQLESLKRSITKVSDFKMSSLQSTAEYTPSLLQEPVPWDRICESVLDGIKSTERSRILKREQLSEVGVARNVSIDVNVDSHVERVVHLPLYIATFEHRGERYNFIVNGQTGAVHGERPIGLGKLGTTLQSLGYIFKGDKVEDLTIVSGADLAVLDKVGEEREIYVAEACYIVWPRSKNYVVKSAVGWISFTNSSENESVELLAQVRGSQKRGFPFLLRPGVTVRAPYKDAWCIEIVAGSPGNIRLDGWQYKEGSKERYDNVLGMA